MQELYDVEIIFYNRKIYVPQSLRRRVLDWYHFYLNHAGVSILEKTIGKVRYWKLLFTQVELFDEMCKTCQQFKKRKTIYGLLPPKNITDLKPQNKVHVDLNGPHRKFIRQQQPGGTFIINNASLTCMTNIDPATGQFEIVEIPMFDLEEVTIGNDEYIDKSYFRVSQMFNST